MPLLKKLRKIRLEKLNNIKKSKINPYPSKTNRTHLISQVLQNFKKLKKLNKKIVLVGRIFAIRTHGKATFLHFKDGTGKIQAYLKIDNLGEKKYRFFLDNFDIGDFIEIKGKLFETKTKEKTILASDFKILAKSLKPLPEKWHGLKDVQERYRKRYLDLIFNPEIKDKFELRSKIIKEIRDFLEKQGLIEVETPILQPLYGGATARPFKTHHNALNIDLYLRIAPELYLKRLLVGGFEKIYEIGRVFRNEGIDKHHNPDFTILEFYWAYANYEDLMSLTEKMFERVLQNIFGKLKISFEGKEINFKKPWQRIEFLKVLKKYAKVDIENITQEKLKQRAKSLRIKLDEKLPKREILDEIYKKYCMPKIWEPAFITNHPIGFQPLAKAKDEKFLANFQLVAGGIELVNAFSELNDPIEQRKRFKEQEKYFKKGFQEAQRLDEDFIEALEYGMPPAVGFGMGIDRLVAILSNSHSLREVILFPTMRPK